MLYLLLLVELVLRVQQWVGPIYDLEFNGIDIKTLSDVINHQPSTLNGKYNELGVRINSLRPQYDSADQPYQVLFMGDSFMQGLSESDTIPQHIWSYFGGFENFKVEFLNAGNSSYSPMIFIPQFKRLIERYDPEIVVLNIDETDLGDDFLRYRHLATRNSSGDVAAVKRTPTNHEFTYGFLNIKKHPLYIIRFFLKIWHTRIYMPLFIKAYLKDRPHVLSYSWDYSEEETDQYSEEIDFFRKNVQELIGLIKTKIPDQNRFVIIYHPHLQHLLPNKRDRKKWQSLVKDTLQELANKHDVLFYDYTEDFTILSDGDYERYYIPKDMHFNEMGLELYGKSVGRYLERQGVFDEIAMQ